MILWVTSNLLPYWPKLSSSDQTKIFFFAGRYSITFSRLDDRFRRRARAVFLMRFNFTWVFENFWAKIEALPVCDWILLGPESTFVVSLVRNIYTSQRRSSFFCPLLMSLDFFIFWIKQQTGSQVNLQEPLELAYELQHPCRFECNDICWSHAPMQFQEAMRCLHQLFRRKMIVALDLFTVVSVCA